MKKPALLSAVSVLALVGGFSSATFAQALAPACPPNEVLCRNVKVTVQGNQIVVDPNPITVTPRTPPAVKIVWYLATPGYRFVDIASDRPVNFPAQYFMSNDSRFCYLWTSDTVYVCTDWNADAFAWGTDYTLKVQAVSGGSPTPVTARVVNN